MESYERDARESTIIEKLTELTKTGELEWDGINEDNAGVTKYLVPDASISISFFGSTVENAVAIVIYIASMSIIIHMSDNIISSSDKQRLVKELYSSINPKKKITYEKEEEIKFNEAEKKIGIK